MCRLDYLSFLPLLWEKNIWYHAKVQRNKQRVQVWTKLYFTAWVCYENIQINDRLYSLTIAKRSFRASDKWQLLDWRSINRNVLNIESNWTWKILVDNSQKMGSQISIQTLRVFLFKTAEPNEVMRLALLSPNRLKQWGPKMLIFAYIYLSATLNSKWDLERTQLVILAAARHHIFINLTSRDGGAILKFT